MRPIEELFALIDTLPEPEANEDPKRPPPYTEPVQKLLCLQIASLCFHITQILMAHSAKGLELEETGADLSLDKFIPFLNQYQIETEQLERINHKINKILALGKAINSEQNYYLTQLSAAITYILAPRLPLVVNDTVITDFNAINKKLEPSTQKRARLFSQKNKHLLSLMQQIQKPLINDAIKENRTAQIIFSVNLQKTADHINKMTPVELLPLVSSIIQTEELHDVLAKKIVTPLFWGRIRQWFGFEPLSNSQLEMIKIIKEHHREFYDKHLHPETITPHTLLKPDSYFMMLDIPPSMKSSDSITPQISTEFVKTLLAKTQQHCDQFPQLLELKKYYEEYGESPTFDLNLVKNFLLAKATYEPDDYTVLEKDSENPTGPEEEKQRLQQLFQTLEPFSSEDRESITMLIGEKYVVPESHQETVVLERGSPKMGNKLF